MEEVTRRVSEVFDELLLGKVDCNILVTVAKLLFIVLKGLQNTNKF